jgi:hypothetical protein
MDPLAEIRKLARYLLGKRSELEALDVKDVVMAKAILDIHRTRTHKEVVAVPLFSLRQIHTLDRENAIAATRRRIEALQVHKEELLAAGTLTCDVLARVLPSVSWIKVVREGDGSYLAFEGNGRIEAMQAVFSLEDDLLVEVEEYRFRNPRKVIRRLNRVRKLNGLLLDSGR